MSGFARLAQVRAGGDCAGDQAAAARPRGKRSFRWLKWVLALALVALLVGEGAYLWPHLHESWTKLTEIHWGAAAVCVVTAAMSMSGFARIQKQLLRAGGVQVSQRASLAVVYGATAMSVSLPAGQVFSTTFTYRQTRRWGASTLVASWQLVTSGVVGVAGMVLLGVGGTVLLGEDIGVWKLVFAVGAVVLLLAGGNHIASNPGAVRLLLQRILHLVNRIRRYPTDAGLDRLEELLRQLDSVELGRRDGALVAFWALVHRFSDVISLGAACLAVGGQPRFAGLMIAFSVGKAVGTIPFAPGGIVYVDATLIYSLTAAAGLPAGQAVAAAFVYRLISFIGVAIAGWIVIAFRFRTPQAGDAEFEQELQQQPAIWNPEPPAIAAGVRPFGRWRPRCRRRRYAPRKPSRPSLP